MKIGDWVKERSGDRTRMLRKGVLTKVDDDYVHINFIVKNWPFPVFARICSTKVCVIKPPTTKPERKRPSKKQPVSVPEALL